jgi:hypothetical protein
MEVFILSAFQRARRIRKVETAKPALRSGSKIEPEEATW